MIILFRVGMAISTILLAASCAKTIEITAPPLDASKTTTARVLVVQSEISSQGFAAPSTIIKGAGEGAANAAGEYISHPPSGDAGILWILTLPIALPVSAGVGAAMAHSEEELRAAVISFNNVLQDERLFASISQRFIAALSESPSTAWDCISEPSSGVKQSCPEGGTVARLQLRPSFRLEAVGEYDPDIHLFGIVVALASVEYSGRDHRIDRVLEAQWVYREEIGSFFNLATNDAVLLRKKVKDILNRFANRIAQDLYLNPQTQTFVKKVGMGLRDIPEGIIVRDEWSAPVWPELRETPDNDRLDSQVADGGPPDKPIEKTFEIICTEAKDPKRPWIGDWLALSGNSRLEVKIDAETIHGRLKSRSKAFPISGKVDERGTITASIQGRFYWDRANVHGTFPILKVAAPPWTPQQPVASLKSPELRELDGQVVRLCS